MAEISYHLFRREWILKKSMKRKKNTDEDDDQSLVDCGIFKVLLLHWLGDRNLRLLILPMVQRTNRNQNRNGIHVFPRWYELLRNIREKPYVYWYWIEKRIPSDNECWKRKFSFKVLKIITPRTSWQSTGFMTVADEIGLLKLNFDVFKGTRNCQRYYQNVLSYNLEISEQQSALVKLLIDNITSESKIQQSLKALVILKHPKTIDEFGNALWDQVEYLTNVVTDAITNLGMEFSASDKSIANLSSKRNKIMQWLRKDSWKRNLYAIYPNFELVIGISKRPTYHGQNILIPRTN